MIYMKQYRSRFIQYILEHRVRSGFSDSTVRQCKNDKSILNNTEKNTTPKIPGVGPQNKPSKSAELFWLNYFPVVRPIPLSRRFFSSKIILNTEAKYSDMIDAVTKSKFIFILVR